MKAFIKLQSQNRTKKFEKQNETFVFKLQNNEKEIFSKGSHQNIDRIHAKKNNQFISRFRLSNKMFRNSCDNIVNSPHCVVGTSMYNPFYKRNISEKKSQDQQIMKAFMRTQDMDKRNSHHQMQGLTQLSNFSKLTPSQKEFLKIQRPNTELLSGKNYRIKKYKVNYLRKRDESDHELFNEIKKVMQQVQNKKEVDNNALDRINDIINQDFQEDQ